MTNTILSSTFLLTLLLFVGLVFFIRASTKDRTQTVQLLSEQEDTRLLEQLRDYFEQRAYRVTAIDPENNQITLAGFVRPSVFLAVFLSLLAAIGIFCLALVLSFLFHEQTPLWGGLALFSPLAGVFYWRKSGREEQVSFRIKSLPTSTPSQKSLLTVIAHRDELANLQRALSLKKQEVESV
ncbi:MAG: cofactor assembly of complex C subunit B [Leptolyngbyaceae cyanobacterium MO_188.B28]|nr:cofactor assembly of complex C subunit B [Leptolyngbyaceae cyanobacterium MO_188.B28]